MVGPGPGGKGGSGGADGQKATAAQPGHAGAYGGGGGGGAYCRGGGGGALAYKNNIPVTPGTEIVVTVGTGGASSGVQSGAGGSGAVRIVWPGNTRQFPSLNVGAD